MSETESNPTTTRARTVLLGSAIATVVLYLIPSGYYVIYPLMLFSTYAHEMGHGIAAMLMGGEFLEFKMWANGSGVASHRGSYGAFARAFISAGGLLGPAILSAVFFVMGRRPTLSRLTLYIFALASILAVVLKVRNGFGIFFVLALAVILLAIAKFGGRAIAQLVTVFLAVQLGLSVFSRGDYLFMEYAETSAGRMPSDVSHISEALFGPYWLWGGIVGLICVVILAAGGWIFFRSGISEETESEVPAT